MKTGVVFIKVKLELNQDMNVMKVPDFVNELDYEIKDEKGRIQNTEIIDCDYNNSF
jgi:divalent metal cation (Fe/Co/Zn/Cd) transporter